MALNGSEPDGTSQASPPLSHRQELAVAAILSCATLEAARQKTRVGKTTLFKWLKQPSFQTALQRQRTALVDQAFNRLRVAMTQATEKLIELLGAPEPGIQLRAAQTILEHGIKAEELQALERRLEAIEDVVLQQRGGGWRSRTG